MISNNPKKTKTNLQVGNKRLENNENKDQLGDKKCEKRKNKTLARVKQVTRALWGEAKKTASFDLRKTSKEKEEVKGEFKLNNKLSLLEDLEKEAPMEEDTLIEMLKQVYPGTQEELTESEINKIVKIQNKKHRLVVVKSLVDMNNAAFLLHLDKHNLLDEFKEEFADQPLLTEEQVLKLYILQKTKLGDILIKLLHEKNKTIFSKYLRNARLQEGNETLKGYNRIEGEGELTYFKEVKGGHFRLQEKLNLLRIYDEGETKMEEYKLVHLLNNLFIQESSIGQLTKEEMKGLAEIKNPRHCRVLMYTLSELNQENFKNYLIENNLDKDFNQRNFNFEDYKEFQRENKLREESQERRLQEEKSKTDRKGKRKLTLQELQENYLEEKEKEEKAAQMKRPEWMTQEMWKEHLLAEKQLETSGKCSQSMYKREKQGIQEFEKKNLSSLEELAEMEARKNETVYRQRLEEEAMRKGNNKNNIYQEKQKESWVPKGGWMFPKRVNTLERDLNEFDKIIKKNNLDGQIRRRKKKLYQEYNLKPKTWTDPTAGEFLVPGSDTARLHASNPPVMEKPEGMSKEDWAVIMEIQKEGQNKQNANAYNIPMTNTNIYKVNLNRKEY